MGCNICSPLFRAIANERYGVVDESVSPSPFDTSPLANSYRMREQLVFPWKFERGQILDANGDSALPNVLYEYHFEFLRERFGNPPSWRICYENYSDEWGIWLDGETPMRFQILSGPTSKKFVSAMNEELDAADLAELVKKIESEQNIEWS